MIALLLSCAMPEAEPQPEVTWEASCDGWECPEATGLEWGDSWVVCSWHCGALDGAEGVDVEVALELRGGCWEVTRVAVENVDCSWLSY